MKARTSLMHPRKWVVTLYSMATQPRFTPWVSVLLLLAEAVLSVAILLFIPYTEIDWVAYMEEVKGFLDGERDYMNLKGGTGPLVYPAGFVYLFSLLYKVTDEGTNIFLAQCIFAGLYLVFTAVVFAIYSKTQTPPYVLVFLTLSKRIHSIFSLRLFNDCFAMLFCYLALYLFMKRRWNWGSLMFTVGVSIKMNVLLYAPGLLYLFLLQFGPVHTIPKLAICGLFQVIVGLPFMLDHFSSYMIRSFELGREFMYKWTVNWRFVPEDIFLSKTFAMSLLLLHISALIFFALYKWSKITVSPRAPSKGSSSKAKDSSTTNTLITPDSILLVLTSSNLIGIVFARSLHYQFYVWYFHTLPFLLWKTKLPVWLRIILLVGVEICWNTYPSTTWSSSLLLWCHLIILLSVALAPFSPNQTTKQTKSL